MGAEIVNKEAYVDNVLLEGHSIEEANLIVEMSMSC